MAKPNVSTQQLRDLLNYDPNTGVFTWRIKPSKYRPINAGERAGCLSEQGYVKISRSHKRRPGRQSN